MINIEKVRPIAVGFVVYRADNHLLKRIFELANNNYAVFVFDNYPEDAFLRQYNAQFKNFRYFTCGQNVGLGYGISTVTSNAYFEGFRSMIFFDQDTIFSIQTLKFIEQNESLLDDFAAISFASNVNSKWFEKRLLIINSGCLFNLEILKKNNWHNTSFFVDGVDYDYCLRLKILGYKIACISNTPDFDHISGQDDKSYLLFGLKLRLRPYSIERIKDSIKAYFKLILQSLINFEFELTFKFVFFLLIYCYNQILVRVLDFFKIAENKIQ